MNKIEPCGINKMQKKTNYWWVIRIVHLVSREIFSKYDGWKCLSCNREFVVLTVMIFTEARSLQSICGKEVSQEELDLLDQSERAVEPEVESSQLYRSLSHSLRCLVFSLPRFRNPWNSSLKILPLKRNEAG